MYILYKHCIAYDISVRSASAAPPCSRRWSTWRSNSSRTNNNTQETKDTITNDKARGPTAENACIRNTVTMMKILGRTATPTTKRGMQAELHTVNAACIRLAVRLHALHRTRPPAQLYTARLPEAIARLYSLYVLHDVILYNIR